MMMARRDAKSRVDKRNSCIIAPPPPEGTPIDEDAKAISTVQPLTLMQNTEEGKGKENRMSEHWDDQIELDQDIDFLKLPMKRIDTNCRVFPLISKTESTNKCAKYWIYPRADSKTTEQAGKIPDSTVKNTTERSSFYHLNQE